MAIKSILVQNNRSGALQRSSYITNTVLTANTAVAVAVPQGTGTGTTGQYALIAANQDIYIRYNETLAGTAAVVPSGNVTDGTGVELMTVAKPYPAMRFIDIAVKELSIISASNAIVTICWYSQ